MGNREWGMGNRKIGLAGEIWKIAIEHFASIWEMRWLDRSLRINLGEPSEFNRPD